MSLATRINRLRLKEKQSLQDVADGVGVSKTHIWELEKGRANNPSADLVEKLADHFNVTVANLIGEEISGDEQVMRMMRQVGKLSPNDRDAIDAVIQSFRNRKSKNDSTD